MRKVLSLVLALVLVLGLSSVAFAADRISATADEIALGNSWNNGYNKNIAYKDLGNLEINADAEMWFSVDAIFGVAKGTITKSDLSSDKYEVKTRVSKGGNLIKGVSFSTKKENNVTVTYIKLEFVDEWVSTKDGEFDFVLYLQKNKARLTETETQITGVVKNVELTVDDGDTYIYTGDKVQVKALAYIKEIEVDLGNGVSIFTKMFTDKKYYGTCTQDVKDTDAATLAQYPAIDSVFYINTVGLNGAGNTVAFDIADKLFVYNADLEYLGTTKDRVPYSTKYFVSTTELDVDTDTDEPSAPATPATPSNPPMGGDLVPANANDNPGTGR